MPIANPIPLLKSVPLLSFANDCRKWLEGAKRGTYSQDGEDLILLELLPEERGTYVDVGANHPFKLSNTYSFYRKGWSGICVEPMPFLYSLLKKWRRKDICLNVGVGRSTGTLKFHVLTPHVLSTFRDDAAEELIRTGKAHLDTVLDVPVIPLASILKDNLQNRKLDLLCIDTEGFDLEVLESNDWDLFRPRVILVEKGSPGLGRTADPVNSFLISQKYEFVQQTAHNCIFKNRLAQT